MRLGIALFGTSLVLALTTGCANVAWEKAGSTPTVASSDLNDCYQKAHLNTPPQFSPNRNTAFSNAASDAQRDTSPSQFPNTAFARDSQTEQTFAMRCMQEKGYQLVRK